MQNNHPTTWLIYPEVQTALPTPGPNTRFFLISSDGLNVPLSQDISELTVSGGQAAPLRSRQGEPQTAAAPSIATDHNRTHAIGPARHGPPAQRYNPYSDQRQHEPSRIRSFVPLSDSSDEEKNSARGAKIKHVNMDKSPNPAKPKQPCAFPLLSESTASGPAARQSLGMIKELPDFYFYQRDKAKALPTTVSATQKVDNTVKAVTSLMTDVNKLMTDIDANMQKYPNGTGVNTAKSLPCDFFTILLHLDYLDAHQDEIYPDKSKENKFTRERWRSTLKDIAARRDQHIRKLIEKGITSGPLMEHRLLWDEAVGPLFGKERKVIGGNPKRGKRTSLQKLADMAACRAAAVRNGDAWSA